MNDAVWAGLQRVGFSVDHRPSGVVIDGAELPGGWVPRYPGRLPWGLRPTETEARLAALDHLRRTPALMQALLVDIADRTNTPIPDVTFTRSEQGLWAASSIHRYVAEGAEVILAGDTNLEWKDGRTELTWLGEEWGEA